MSYFDVTDANHDEIVKRCAAMVLSAPPAIVEHGLGWYEQAHDSAGVLAVDLGVTRKQAAGVLAAASPGVEAGENFAAIHALIDGTNPRLTTKQRDKALACLVKCPTEVLSPRTGPKTWAFFWNIYAPGLRDHVTVDGRHADVIANRMRPWQANRGIEVGGPGTRYESYEFVTEDVARHLRKLSRFSAITAVQVQAVLWCEGRRIERQGLTTRGTPRQQGCFRRGQHYT